ncbi:MAG TPA: hypothetical protein PLV68_06535, partial [Ilumatobacteraceae bacterium]|nr:hypothetical protein [Ilumatobacteraceae bacterium]
RPLYDLARQGLEVERAARPVTISRFDLFPTGGPLVWRAEVECSTGTYIRSLADDLGRLLGGGAHLRNLRRTRVGRFTLADAQPIDEVVLAPVAAAVAHLDSASVDERGADPVAHGR